MSEETANTEVQPEVNSEQQDDFFTLLSSDDSEKQFEGVRQLRKSLSEPSEDLINQIVEQDLLQKIFSLLLSKPEEQSQVNLLWVISQIYGSEHFSKEEKISLEIEELFIDFLDTKSESLLEAALGSISKIIQKNKDFRNFCIEKDCVSRLLKVHQEWQDNIPIKGSIVLTLSSLLAQKPLPDWQDISEAVSVLNQALVQDPTPEIFHQAAKALALTNQAYQKELLELGCVPAFLQIVMHSDIKVFHPILGFLGNLIVREEGQAKEILQHPNFIPRVFELALDSREAVQKDAMWVISNIAADSPHYTLRILMQPKYMEAIQKAVLTGSPKVKVEGAWTIFNLVNYANRGELGIMVNQYDLFQCLGEILSHEKPEIVGLGLDIAFRVLNSASHLSPNPLAKKFIEEDLLSQVQEGKEKGSEKAKERISQIESLCEEKKEEDLKEKEEEK